MHKGMSTASSKHLSMTTSINNVDDALRLLLIHGLQESTGFKLPDLTKKQTANEHVSSALLQRVHSTIVVHLRL